MNTNSILNNEFGNHITVEDRTIFISKKDLPHIDRISLHDDILKIDSQITKQKIEFDFLLENTLFLWNILKDAAGDNEYLIDFIPVSALEANYSISLLGTADIKTKQYDFTCLMYEPMGIDKGHKGIDYIAIGLSDTEKILLKSRMEALCKRHYGKSVLESIKDCKRRQRMDGKKKNTKQKSISKIEEDKADDKVVSEHELWKKQQHKKFLEEVWDMDDPKSGFNMSLVYCANEPWKLNGHTMKVIYDNYAPVFNKVFGSDEKLWECIMSIVLEFAKITPRGEAGKHLGRVMKEMREALDKRDEEAGRPKHQPADDPKQSSGEVIQFRPRNERSDA